jgi:quinolinate synthase
VRRAAQSPAGTFIVATEVGILHRMQEQSPGKRFLAASEAAVCPYMKKITLEKVARSLERMAPRVTVDPAIAAQAKRAIDRMLEIVPTAAPRVPTAA